MGLPDFHCKLNWNHIYLSHEELVAHEVVCEQELEKKKADDLLYQQNLNKALENQEDDVDRLNAYRADQIEDARISTSNLLLNWNEDTPEQNTDVPKVLSTQDINEDEVG